MVKRFFFTEYNLPRGFRALALLFVSQLCWANNNGTIYLQPECNLLSTLQTRAMADEDPTIPRNGPRPEDTLVDSSPPRHENLQTFQEPDQLIAFLQRHGGASIQARRAHGQYVIGPVKVQVNGRLEVSEILFLQLPGRSNWLCSLSDPNVPADIRLDAKVNFIPMTALHFDPENLSPPPRAPAAPIVGNAAGLHNPFVQANRPAPLSLFGASHITGEFTPSTGEPNIEHFRGQLQIRDRRFSTEHGDLENYVAIPNARGEVLLGRIVRIWRHRGSNNEFPQVDVILPGASSPQTLSWNNLMAARPDRAAKVLFDRILNGRAAAANPGHAPAPQAQRAAGSFNPDRARIFKQNEPAQLLNRRNLSLLEEHYAFQEGRDFTPARNPDGSPLAPFSIEHGDYDRINNNLSDGTVMNVVPNLRNVDIFEIKYDQFMIRNPDRNPTPFTPALRSPELTEMIRIAQRRGTRIVIDPTVHINDAGGFYRTRNNMIIIPPDITTHAMRHELQHAIFETSGLRGNLHQLLTNPRFNQALRANNVVEASRLFGELISPSSLRDTAAAAHMPVENYRNLLQQYVLYGLGTAPASNFPYSITTALNETMSVAAELHSFETAGVPHSDPRYVRTRNYALQWQRDFLQAIPPQQLLGHQRQMLERARSILAASQ